MADTIFVYEQWSEDNPVLMGRLFTDSLRGKETYAFEYDREWLAQNAAGLCFLDPDLFLFQGR